MKFLIVIGSLCINSLWCKIYSSNKKCSKYQILTKVQVNFFIKICGNNFQINRPLISFLWNFQLNIIWLLKINILFYKDISQLTNFIKIFTFFGLLSSSSSPCLAQRFGRYTLKPSSGGWNVELNPLFRLPG